MHAAAAKGKRGKSQKKAIPCVVISAPAWSIFETDEEASSTAGALEGSDDKVLAATGKERVVRFAKHKIVTGTAKQ